MLTYTYTTKGSCVKTITVTIHDNILKEVIFQGGCPGNLSAIKLLVEGMQVDDIINKLQNVMCGNKKTSCANQLCEALKIAKSLKQA